MEIKKEMSTQASDQAPVIFHYVSACFSEEEWTFLHAWQKEFYRNVIREIHQALISLGYQIINPDTLIQVNKREEANIPDPQAIDRGDNNDPTSTCYPVICPDMLLRFKQEEPPYCGNQYDPEEHVFSNSPNKGYHIVKPDILIQTTMKGESEIQDPQAIERRYNDPTSACYPTIYPDALLLIKQEEEPYCSYQYDRALSSFSYSPSKVIGEMSTSDILFSINREENLYLKDHQDTGGRESNNYLTTGDEITNRKMNAEDSVKTIEETTQSENSGHAKEKEIWNCERGKNSIIQLWTGSNQELRGEKATHHQSGFCSLENCSLCHSIPKVENYDGFENDLQNAKCVADLPNTIQNQSSNVCSEREKSVSHNIVTTHHRTQVFKRNTQLGDTDQKVVRYYQCTQCEKSFNRRGTLNRHLITHTEERPYQCSECNKCFSDKGHLVRHFRMHTGERPFQCTECEKCFRQAKSLKIHKRTHFGERPYQCTECDKSFTSNDILISHQITHADVKPYQCTECWKSFSRKSHLISHRKTHTGLRPYQCTECLKSFSRKSHLLRHCLTHTDLRPYQCTECLKSFGQKSHLTRHRITHTELRPYNCN